MICFNCGLKLHTGDEKECQLCGVKFPHKCSSCGFPNPSLAKYCFNCGSVVTKPSLQSSIQNYETLIESRKNVAVIFADVSGFTALSEKMDPEEVREIINDCFNYITRPVYELEGTIDKYIGDCIMILFGAKYTHSDDALRAVLCAMKMMDLVREYSESTLAPRGLSIGLSIGVNYGLVVTGSVGNYFDKDYTVMGDIVNTAQRLQSSAGKDIILVAESVYMETRDVIHYSNVSEVVVKNKEKPVRCYSPVMLNKDYSFKREMWFIGREDEVSALNATYNDIMNTGTRCIMVSGEPGIGKTRIIKEFTSKIGSGVKKIWIDLSPSSQNRVYYVISSILTNAMNINPEDNSSVKQHRLISFIDYILGSYSGEEKKRNYDFIGLILGLSRDNQFQNILDSMSFDAVRREMVRQFLLFFENMCRKYKIIVVVDDMHWADSSSLNMLGELASHLTAVNAAFIFASRCELDEFKALDTRLFCDMKLSYLEKDEINVLACKLMECDSLDGGLFDAIVKFTRGNPLYIKEFISNIKRHGRYAIENGTAYIDAEEASMLPNNIQNLILANLSEFDNDSRSILQVASVIGKDFSLSLVSSILECPVDEKYLLRLPVQLNIISLKTAYTSAGVIEKVYTFNQDIEREAIYDSILNKTKKEFHRKIGEFIESRYYKEIDGYYEILCNHFHMGSMEKKAAEYYYKTALKYKNDFNFSSSLDYFKRFLDMADPHSQGEMDSMVLYALMDVGYIHFVMADYDSALSSMTKANTIANISDDVYTIKIMIADIHKEQGRFDEALSIIDEMEAKVRQDSNIYGKLLRMKCEILRIMGNPEALSFARKAEKILLRAKEYQSLAETINQAGIIYFMKGDIENALTYLNKSYKYAEKIGNLEIMSKVSGNLGIIYYTTGMVSKAFDFLNKSVSVSKKISDQQGYISGCNNLGVLYLDKGLFDKAEETFNESLVLSMEISSRLNECMTMTNLGDVMYERGLNERALEYYSSSIGIARDINVPTGEAVNCMGIAKVNIDENRIEGVAGILETAFEILNSTGELEFLSDYYRLRAMYELSLSSYDGALEYCEKAIEASVEYRNDRRKLKGLRLKANVLIKSGATDKAVKLLNESITLAEYMESDYEAAKNYFKRYEAYKLSGKDEYALRDLVKAKEYIARVDECKWTHIIGSCEDIII